MGRREHWNDVYRAKPETELGWYKAHLERSLGLIRRTGVGVEATLIDVGGGASTLVGDLLGEGFRNLTVLDISEAAIEAARKRLGTLGDRVTWIVADILDVELPEARFDLWHDRAVFHFLTDEGDRGRYLANLKRSLAPGGHVILAAFSLSGPRKCSGLEVVRYSAESLHSELGASDFDRMASEEETHLTPGGKAQHYVYCWFRRRPAPS